jgi:hypothetical protein
MAGNLLRVGQDDLIVRALEVREALGARDLAILEAQAGEAVAAHGGLAAAVRGHEGEPAHGQPRGGGACGHATNGAAYAGHCAWPGG